MRENWKRLIITKRLIDKKPQIFCRISRKKLKVNCWKKPPNPYKTSERKLKRTWPMFIAPRGIMRESQFIVILH